MKSLQTHNGCPKCDFHKMAAWPDLDDEQQMLAERLPASAEFSLTERKKHRFCTRCWFEDAEKRVVTT